MIAVLRQPRSRSALPNEALFLLLFLPLAVVAHDRAERGTRRVRLVIGKIVVAAKERSVVGWKR